MSQICTHNSLQGEIHLRRSFKNISFSTAVAPTYRNATQPQDMVLFELKGAAVIRDWTQYFNELLGYLARFTSPHEHFIKSNNFLSVCGC